MVEFWKRVALLTDSEFIAWAAAMLLTMAPNENPKDFRVRVIHTIERMGEEFNV